MNSHPTNHLERLKIELRKNEKKRKGKEFSVKRKLKNELKEKEADHEIQIVKEGLDDLSGQYRRHPGSRPVRYETNTSRSPDYEGG